MDVISQGRDPRRNFRLPLTRRWRIVAGCAAVLVVAVALTVTGLRSRPGAGTPGTPGAPGAPGAAASPLPLPAPVTQTTGSPVFVVCSPSRGKCTNKFIIVDGRAAHFAQRVTPTGR